MGLLEDKEVSKDRGWHPGNGTPTQGHPWDGSEGKSSGDRCVENPDSSAKKRRSWPDLSKKIVDVMGNLIPLTLWKAVLAFYWMVWEGSAINVKTSK